MRAGRPGALRAEGAPCRGSPPAPQVPPSPGLAAGQRLCPPRSPSQPLALAARLLRVSPPRLRRPPELPGSAPARFSDGRARGMLQALPSLLSASRFALVRTPRVVAEILGAWARRGPARLPRWSPAPAGWKEPSGAERGRREAQHTPWCLPFAREKLPLLPLQLFHREAQVK